MSYAASAIFNEPSGLSLASINDLSQNATVGHHSVVNDSAYAKEVRGAVNDYLFGQQSSLNSLSPDKSGTSIGQPRSHSGVVEPKAVVAAAMSSPSTLPQSTDVTESHTDSANDVGETSAPELSDLHHSNRSLRDSNRSDTTGLFDSTLLASATRPPANTLSLQEGDPFQAPVVGDAGCANETLTADGYRPLDCNNSNAQQTSIGPLGKITPGLPVCESSHIPLMGARSTSERSTHYLSIAKSQPQGHAPSFASE